MTPGPPDREPAQPIPPSDEPRIIKANAIRSRGDAFVRIFSDIFGFVGFVGVRFASGLDDERLAWL